MAAPTAAFKDTSTDCAICLSSLYGADEDDDTAGQREIDGGAAHAATRMIPTIRPRIIELSCGHLYHFECVRMQLEQAQPQFHQRLLFSGTRCAKCSTFCDHPDLASLTRTTDELRLAVDRLIVEQLQVDHPEYRSVLGTASGSPFTEEAKQLVEHGRRSYAFYLCSQCRAPYFGGTVECADQDAAAAELSPNERLCPSCSPPSQSIACADTVEHAGYHVWKCRYCCQPARYLCYGTTHFCDDCHARNSARVRQQQQYRYHPSSSSGTVNEPPRLDPVPCPGRGVCLHPFPTGADQHVNGATPDCEQVYYCACCDSRHQGLEEANHEESGSQNWIVNASGEHGLRGWTQHGRAWQVEAIELPLTGSDASSPIATNFVSSYHWCVQSQTIPLASVIREPARLEARCRYMGRSDCPSVFRMEVLVLGHPPVRGPSSAAPAVAPVLQRISLPERETSPDCWDTARIEIPGLVDPSAAAAVVLVVAGKDQRFWAGNFGSKVADCTVRVLGDDAELDRVLQPDARQRWEVRVRQLVHPMTGASSSYSCRIA